MSGFQRGPDNSIKLLTKYIFYKYNSIRYIGYIDI
jgi:hypothetical protein